MLKRERRYNNVLFPALLVCGFFYSFPTIAMITSAMKGEKGIMADTGLFPRLIDMSALSDVLGSNYFQNSLKNSTVIALWVCLFCVSIAVLTGDVLSRNQGKDFQAYYILLLVLQMFPLTLRLFPLFKIFKSMNILNTHLCLILTYTGINLPFSALTMKAFFDTVPFDIEESAMADGCGHFRGSSKLYCMFHWRESLPCLPLHLPHSLIRGAIFDTSDWMAAVTHLYNHYTTDDYWYYEGKVSALDHLKAGVTTTVCIISAETRCDDPIFSLNHAKAYVETGLREVSYEEMIESLKTVIGTLNHAHNDHVRAFVSSFGLLPSTNPISVTQPDRMTQLKHKDELMFSTNGMFNLPPHKLLEMITIDAAKVIGWDDEIGSLETGKKADIITIDLMNPRMTPRFNIVDTYEVRMSFNSVFFQFGHVGALLIGILHGITVCIDSSKTVWNISATTGIQNLQK